MAKMFEDLEIWQQARCLCKEIYKMTCNKDFRFRDQIRAASGSVMDNIAEGFERNGNKEFIQFLFIAKGSCGEVRSQLYRALDNNYITQEEHNELNNTVLQISKSIFNFVQYLKNSEITGHKNLKA